MSVYHGPWVETRNDEFFEGAWDADYETHPDRATFFTGTAGRIDDGSVVLATATDRDSHLFLVASKDRLFVSNSLTLALVMADDEPDPAYAYYIEDFYRLGRSGVSEPPLQCPTKRGSFLIFFHCTLRADQTLRWTRKTKAEPDCPSCYTDHVEMLSGSIGRVLQNAASPARQRPLEALATLSSGYDSPAVAALARHHGCKRAITFAESPEGDPDHGGPIADALGIEHRVLSPEPPPLHEPEFAICPPGGASSYAGSASLLEGKILLTGHMGDSMFGMASNPLPDLRGTGLPRISGSSCTEFRLRVGYVTYAPLFWGWQHMSALRAISHSDEMAPFRIGGTYDRPIARRILEEAGVARGAFGQRKIAGAARWILHPKHLTPSSRQDYEAFVRSREPVPIHRWLALHAVRLASSVLRRAGRPAPLPFSIPQFAPTPANALVFHWGFHHTKTRYEAAHAAMR